MKIIGKLSIWDFPLVISEFPISIDGPAKTGPTGPVPPSLHWENIEISCTFSTGKLSYTLSCTFHPA